MPPEKAVFWRAMSVVSEEDKTAMGKLEENRPPLMKRKYNNNNNRRRLFCSGNHGG